MAHVHIISSEVAQHIMEILIDYKATHAQDDLQLSSELDSSMEALEAGETGHFDPQSTSLATTLTP